MKWLPNPPDGSAICLAFDGSETNDFSAIRAETADGYQFTPRVLGDRPSIWNPAEHDDHRIPRHEIHAALEELFDRYKVGRFYYDPPMWTTEGEAWSRLYGEERVLPWETYRTRQMHAALERFVTDLRTGAITHDGCPITALHIASAVKVGRRGMETYGLAKASRLQKIDAAVTSVLAHQACSDARATGWSVRQPPKPRRMAIIR